MVKVKINWWRIVAFFIVSAALVLITHSFAMSLGIFIILLLIDSYLAQLERKRRV